MCISSLCFCKRPFLAKSISYGIFRFSCVSIYYSLLKLVEYSQFYRYANWDPSPTDFQCSLTRYLTLKIVRQLYANVFVCNKQFQSKNLLWSVLACKDIGPGINHEVRHLQQKEYEKQYFFTGCLSMDFL